MIERFVSVSGGKDSGAVYLLIVKRGKPFRAVFADTDNEHEVTIEFVRNLHKKTGGPRVEFCKADFTSKFEGRRQRLPALWSKAGVSDKHITRAMELMHPTGNAFLDLCLLRGGFPGVKARYCTQELKLKPLADTFYNPAIKRGGFVISFTGVRSEESFARSLQPRRVRAGKPRSGRGVYMPASYKPIFDWTLADVMKIHAEFGMDINPLYHRGVERVGCWPCIFARKAEIRAVSETSPEHIERLEEWEALVTECSRSGFATWFPAKNLSKDRANWNLPEHGIRGQEKWASGGRYLPGFEPENTSAVAEEYETACALFGACE